LVAVGEAAGQVRLGEVEPGLGERDAGGADRGLRAGPLAGPERRVHQGDQDGAGRPRLGGGPGGGLDLGDDLVLADRHRVQPARDREQMPGGRAAEADAGRLKHIVDGDPPVGGQDAGHGPGHPVGRPSARTG
jgi:hypothetical protein